jgi:catechol 2,3-dioxygenase-like lactoylglutathione lyase family enzyme
MKLLRLDHADVRVTSLIAVERFYDAVLPALGLSRKTESHVDRDGEWHEVGEGRPRNAVEYNTPLEPGSAGWFVGFVENAGFTASPTRIAFAIDDGADLGPVETLLREAGARSVERSDADGYPALFFEDPLGTRLEICARAPRS